MKLKEKWNMIVKGISIEDFPENWVGKWSNRSLRMRTMIVLESFPTDLTRRVVQYFYQNSVVCFREPKAFFLKRYFLIHGLGKCEGVDEDLRHEFGHVDIQVGSHICLSVCLH